MKQAIAGVAPPQTEEVTSMTVWPSICCFWLGRQLGQAFAVQWPGLYVLRLGNLAALLGIPFALAMYFFRLHPCIYGLTPYGVTYRLTNRHVQELRNEIHFNDQKTVIGAVLALVFAVIGFAVGYVALAALVVVGYFLLGNNSVDLQNGPPSTWLLIGASVIAVVGAGKGFFLGTMKFIFGAEVKSVQLDRFDAVDVEIQPGQGWYKAGDLVFRLGDRETFRLTGVSRPEAFRSACMKAQAAYVGVQSATGGGAAAGA